MNDALEVLRVKWDLFVLALRIALLKRLGVDVLIERAFKEGYSMANDHEGIHCYWDTEGQAVVEVIHVWKSVDEAWVNSDAQELFDENA